MSHIKIKINTFTLYHLIILSYLGKINFTFFRFVYKLFILRGNKRTSIGLVTFFFVMGGDYRIKPATVYEFGATIE